MLRPSFASLGVAPMITLQDWQAGGQTLLYRNHRIYVRHGGVDSAPTLLLIHGFPTASWDWQALWPTLTQHYRVITLDLIGFGFSAKPKNYAYHTFDQADLCLFVLKHFGVQHYHILAHDYGDTVAQELLARQIEFKSTPLIQSLCLLNGGIFVEAARPLLIQKLLASALGPLIAQCSSKAMFARNMRRIFGKKTPLSALHIDEYWHLLDREQGKSALAKTIRYLHERKRYRERWVDALRRTGLPIHAIMGDADPISGHSMIRRYRELLPHGGLTILNGIGHYPQLESAPAVWAAYLAFRQRMAS